MIIFISKDISHAVANKVLVNLNKNEPSAFDYYFNHPNLRVATDRLAIVDLRANQDFQTMFDAENFAKELYDFGLSDAIKSIDLLVSDIEADGELCDSLSHFASVMANTLKEDYQLDIEIRIISDHRFLTTLLVPPSETNNDWEIYGINDSLKGKNLNYEKLINNVNKKLIWKGEDITNWLNHPQRVFVSHAKQFKLS